jgi:hypothetical protein
VSDERRTRRRFLADLLFAGGAVTAASVLGYVATHEAPAATPTPVAPVPPPPQRLAPAGDVAPVRPEGQTIATPPAQSVATPRFDMRAAGAEEPAPRGGFVPETGGRCK